ncbi:DUF4360 domain-containing protein [Nostoc sp.]|uniref:DUF4360 domain-containing protein n=1 Tax=Nostoc sp. TaxID=1180 RepID=UPI002FF7BCB7
MNFKQFGVLVSISTILGMNLIATKALAQESPSITFGDAIAAGGCSIADQQVGEDGRTLSLILNNFSAYNGQRNRCIIRINTSIPSGFNVQEVNVLYQGSVEVGASSKGSNLSRSYSFSAGNLGQVVATPQKTDFKVSDDLFEVQDNLAVISASCGGQGQLGFNLIEKSNPGSNIIVDTTDVNAGKVILSLDLIPCS